MDLSVLSKRKLKIVGGYLNRAVKVLEQPMPISWRFAGYGAFGDTHDEGEHVDDDDDDDDPTPLVNINIKKKK